MSKAKRETAYGKTPIGQLIYDLCFTRLTAPVIARRHAMPITEVRRVRALKELAELRLKVQLDRRMASKPPRPRKRRAG